MRYSSIASTAIAFAMAFGGLTTPSSALSQFPVIAPVDASGVTNIANGDLFMRRNGKAYYNGRRGSRERRSGYRHYNGFWFPAEAFFGAVIINGIVQGQYRVHGSSAHIRWCMNRYRTYSARTDTFQPYEGNRRRCNSPYN